MPEADRLSGESTAQAISSGIGQVLPYVLAGSLARSALRTTGLFVMTEGTAGRIMANESAAQILGAGLYDVARTPRPGESHFGNGVASVLSFSTFEAGNILAARHSGFNALALRMVAGFSGGVLHRVSSDIVIR